MGIHKKKKLARSPMCGNTTVCCICGCKKRGRDAGKKNSYVEVKERCSVYAWG
jgi:hypothetical protein